ncbi:hypothetical protein [Nonomuraea cavernae]|uniref:Uncharacterized protein n=1 Tax=Nonomuraea cavernae TaxID=2045107 RepID=A0A917ZCE6_9ACTN|nr:hypothetical protein [Nonomuraea cavernae]MCA2190374.1 hypothetical protein [Nonomuraea cavernae]GGO80795.1 hypothetical protein GCM10012289_68270 [Nonomuraea cavernae]
MPVRFSAARWERAYREVVASAFRRVPFYRDQWVAAGRALAEPEPTPSAALSGQLHRLCPFARPFDPSREPSLWIGDGRDLRDALALAGASRRTPVAEVRAAVLDRRALGPRGPRYGALLAPGADVVDEDRRRALNAAALALLGAPAQAGQVIVVGERAALEALGPELDDVRAHAVERMTAASAVQDPRPGVLYDPHLGYFAATHPACGRAHLLWRRFHARPAGRAWAVTALRRRRPVLLDVLPDGSGTPGATTLTTGTPATAVCADHGTPVLTTH